MDGTHVAIRSGLVELERKAVILIQGIGRLKVVSTLRTVCGSPSRFFHCTVVPTATVIDVGANMNS
jgi:hypothetical protein